MTAKDREKLKAEFRAELEREKEAERLNKNTFRKVMNGFEDEFKKFNWKEEITAYRSWNGTAMHAFYPQQEAWKVRSAIGTLARAAFRVKSSSAIPSGKEERLREVTKSILEIILKEVI